MKLLVTGASGFLGWNVCQEARAEWQVHGTHLRGELTLAGVTGHRIDLRDRDATAALLDALRPDALIHAAAQARPELCQAQPSASARINVDAAAQLAELCAARSIRMVQVSTDLVFDGEHAPYAEHHAVAPHSVYGQQKARAETLVQARHPGAAIARLPLLFGAAPAGAQSCLQPILGALRSGAALRLFQDEIRTPVSARCAARSLLLAARSWQGSIHLGGREAVSRHQLGTLAAQVFALDPGCLVPVRQADVPTAAPRPRNVALDSRRAFALGHDPLPLRDALRTLRGTV
jgi:dTDP-4-dehydrorhamnose reductase